MNQVDLAFTPALEQAKLIKKGDLSPLELTQLYLNRIEKYNPQLGAYYTLVAGMALEDAKTKTEQLNKTENLPPFFGIPTAIKDLHAVANIPLSFGVAALKNNIPDYDEAVVTKMKLAGFTILGKTAASQVGSFPYTECPGFAPSRNPCNLDYTSGGSSGGAAAAVASGLCSVSHGTDGGGSIRIPAACCGVVGIKPSRGRISCAPIGDYQNGIATHGPIARNVADAAALLDVMSGYVTGDPYWLNEPEISFWAASQQPPSQLRIAIAKEIEPLGKCVDMYAQKINEIGDRLSNLGHIIEEDCPSLGDLVKPFIRIWQAGIGATGIPLEILTPINRQLAESAGSAAEYLQAVAQMQMISRRIVGFFDKYDVLLLPVLMHPPIKVGEWQNLGFEETLTKITQWIAPCPLANASGLPAIALPVGFDENNLPIAIQLIGKPAAETTIISLAAQIEKIYPPQFMVSSDWG